VTIEAESLLPLPPATFHILVALADEDRHGYAVIKDVAARTGGKLKLSPGTLYPLLARMARRGWLRAAVKSRNPRAARIYRITPAGADVLKRLRSSLEELQRDVGNPHLSGHRKATGATRRRRRTKE